MALAEARQSEQAQEFAQRLLETANEHEVHKYIAEAHRLRARIALASGNADEAEAEFSSLLTNCTGIRHP